MDKSKKKVVKSVKKKKDSTKKKTLTKKKDSTKKKLTKILTKKKLLRSSISHVGYDKNYVGGDLRDIENNQNNEINKINLVNINLTDPTNNLSLLTPEDKNMYTELLDILNEGDNTLCVKSYEIFAYGSGLSSKSGVNKCGIENVSHAVIRLIDENDNINSIEWGEPSEKNMSVVSHDIRVGHHYTHKGGNSWFGCRIARGEINPPINFKKVAKHAIIWKNNFTASKNYPNNCRGYVDSFLVSVVQTGVIDKWTK